MKKVINITLGGIVFAIQEDAYGALDAYFAEIKRHFAGNEDYDEISGDIERAIAEKFVSRKRSERMAVTLADVSAIREEMGSAADFSESNEHISKDGADTQDTPPKDGDVKKRLYRDTDDVIIGGVASGLARYFDIDPVIVRIIFVITLFFNGIGLIAYLLLWVIVPAAETTTDKYAMRGERVTLKEITEQVKKNIDSIDKKDIERARGVWANVRGVFVKIFDVVGIVVRALVKALRYIAGIVLVIAGALGIAGLVSGYLVLFFSDKGMLPEEAQMVFGSLIGDTLGVIALLAAFVVVVVPLQALTVAGASLIAGRNFFTVPKSVTLAAVWIVAIVVAATTSALQAEKIAEQFNIHERDDVHIRGEWEGGQFMFEIIPEEESHADAESASTSTSTPAELTS